MMSDATSSSPNVVTDAIRKDAGNVLKPLTDQVIGARAEMLQMLFSQPARDLLAHQLIIADNALCDSKIPRVPGRYPLAGHNVDPNTEPS
jgi:hypothetical protein